MTIGQPVRHKPALKRGGARRKIGQHSLTLTEAQCRNVIGATQAALAAGMPFNRFATLAWELGGIDRQHSVAATGDFIKLAREWMNGQGSPMPWAWVQEWGPKY